jgi:hypothetical protein
MGTNTGMNLGMGMNTGFGINQGFNGNNGMNNGFNQGLNTGFGSNMGLGMNTGMGAAGGFGSTPQTQGNQPKKLVTFDSKSNTNDDFGGFQEAKAKDPVDFVLLGIEELHKC